MAALGWLLNLGFAGGTGEVTGVPVQGPTLLTAVASRNRADTVASTNQAAPVASRNRADV